MTTTFEGAFQSWRDAPFPRGSSRDPADEVHANLALYDTWVAESVVPFMDRGIWQPAVPDVLGALENLGGQVQELRRAGTEDLEALSAYLAYADLLRTVYRAFLRRGGRV
ncbi:hypothetical protein [Microterricola viridarii]|uniref:hypothetical protein n=1 Tax=Microterricola viridarii TaxID=412690 RepID=UPI0012EAD0ED|nr:hypothetical protein [Microterricola viridarii]